jgi:hypothetical protein
MNARDGGGGTGLLLTLLIFNEYQFRIPIECHSVLDTESRICDY